MTIDELLVLVSEVFDRLGIQYLVTGSMATIAYGEPRFTNDIDIAVRLSPGLVQRLCDAFPENDFYLSREVAAEVARSGGQFNILHPSSGLKVDVMVTDDSDFNISRFARGRAVPVTADRRVTFAAPEDVILKKLEFYREGGSDKHLRDVVGVLVASADLVDRAYITTWARRLGVTSVWREVQKAADESSRQARDAD